MSQSKTDLASGDKFDYTSQDVLMMLLRHIPEERWELATGRSMKQVRRYLQGADVPYSVIARAAKEAGPGFEPIASFSGRPAKSDKSDRNIVELPFFDVRASAGAGALVPQHERVRDFMSVSTDWLRRMMPAWAPPNARIGILEGSGDSMQPTIQDGDLIMVVQDVDWRIVEKGGIFVLANDERLVIKRLQVMNNGDLRIISDNKAYETEIVPFKEIEHRVRVLAHVFFVGGRPR